MRFAFHSPLFWDSPVLVCAPVERVGQKETAPRGAKERGDRTTGHVRLCGCEDVRRDVCACKLRIKAYVENIYCPLRMQQNENGNFII